MDRSSRLLAIVIGLGVGLASPVLAADTPLDVAKKEQPAQGKASKKKSKSKEKAPDSSKAAATKKDDGAKKGGK